MELRDEAGDLLKKKQFFTAGWEPNTPFYIRLE
jgi:hypothetical protein